MLAGLQKAKQRRAQLSSRRWQVMSFVRTVRTCCLRLDFAGHDGVVMGGDADGEVALADDGEAGLLIEADGVVVLAVDAEGEPQAAEFAGACDGVVHESATDAAALEAMEQVDAAELVVAFESAGQVWFAADDVADGCVAGLCLCDNDLGIRQVKIFGKRLRRVVLFAVRQQVSTGEDAGEGLKHAGAGDE